MAITKQKKQEIVQDLAGKLKDAKGVVFANFEGLTVAEAEDLRVKCDTENVSVNVAKKSLLNLASKEAGIEGLDAAAFEGGVATFASQTDEVSPAKIVATFAKGHEQVKILAGIMDGEVIDQAKVVTLSKLPSKEELYAKIVGSINAPISGFVNVLAGNLRGLVNVLNGIKDAK